MAENELPLSGVKVLDFTWVMAGPAATRYLADYGATVVKVESATRIETGRTLGPFWQGVPNPDASAFMANVNAGKLGLSLNMALPEGRALAMRLVAWADILCESYTPKVMRAWGMDYERLKVINPGLIMVSSSLNGLTGPWAQIAGYGTAGAALAGFAGFVQWPDRAPAAPFSAYTDYVAPKFVVAAIMAALDYKRRTGIGQQIDVAQSEAAAQFLGPALLDYTVNGRAYAPRGNDDDMLLPHGCYRCSGDDSWVALGIESDDQWQGLRRLIGAPLDEPRFAGLLERRRNRDALDQAISAWTAARSAHDAETALQTAGVPASAVYTLNELFSEQQLVARGHHITVRHETLGEAPVEGSRTRMSATPARVERANPGIGADTEHVLRDLLGLSDEEIVEAVAAGAIE